MKQRIYSIVALACGTWFVLFGWMWTYFANIVFVFPPAIIGFVLWRKTKTENPKVLYKLTGILYLIGTISAIAAILLFTFTNLA